jgi:hypothetical protein
VRSEPTIQGEIEANLSTGSQMTIWGPTDVGRALSLESRLSANVSLLAAMDDRTVVGWEDGAQLWRASRGNRQTTHHTEVYRIEKEIWQFWPHSLRLIAHEQLGFRNLFFGSVANLHYSGAKGF